MSFLTYESARPWAKAIKSAVVARKMPPWFADPTYGHFKNDPTLAQSDIKGTKLHVDAHYDNSPNNKFNPDPTKDVFSGTQTWEEMMAPFFGVVVDVGVDPRQVMNLPGQAGNGG
jgi:hypothetical protein